jgi:hypothetical protein
VPMKGRTGDAYMYAGVCGSWQPAATQLAWCLPCAPALNSLYLASWQR